MIVRHSLIAGGRALNRTARKFFILGPWMLFVIVLVSTFYDPPPQDDNEYQKWAFASFFGTAMPWIFCSIPVLLIADSLETAQALATSVDHDDLDVARHLRSTDLFSASLSSFGVRLEFA